MTKIQSFEEIISWQKAKGLTLEVYKITNDWSDWSLKDQLRRACVSIMNNIAEGFERQSNKDFKHFLYIAKGSCSEVRSMLVLSKEADFIEEVKCEELIADTVDISKLISGFIKTL